MKLIEGMKTLKVTEKKIARNTERINEYASIISTERPAFGTEQEQRKQVESLLQANADLGRDYLALKKRVDYTNLVTTVTIGKESYTISDMLQIQRTVGALMKDTFKALNTGISDRKLQMNRSSYVTPGEKPARVEMMYDETRKYEGLQYWQTLVDEIETRLEVINATTDLL